MSDSQALTEFDMVTVQGQVGLSPSESETVTPYTVSAAAADLSHIAQRSQWRAYWKLPSLFRMVALLTLYDLAFSQNGVPYAPNIREWP